MLSYQETLQKIRTGDIRFRDSEGNNLLHLLMMEEARIPVPCDIVKPLLEKVPYLINSVNNNGDFPEMIMDREQPDDKIANRPLRKIMYQYMEAGPRKTAFKRTFQLSFSRYRQGEDIPLPNFTSQDLTSQPTILCFSGRGGYIPNFVHGVSEVIYNSMGLEKAKKPAFQFLGMPYPGLNWDLCTDYKLSRSATPNPVPADHPFQYVQDFVKIYLHPLYSDEKGEKIDPKSAAKHLQQLIFLGYSYGASVLQMISYAMTQDMRQLHYKKSDIDFIQSQIPALTIGPSLYPSGYQSGFRCYHLLTTHDNVVFEGIKPLLVDLPKEKQPFILTHLKKQENQRVFLLNKPGTTTYPGHHVKNYTNMTQPEFALGNLWKNFILFNALNHSIKSRQTQGFLPLAQKLSALPKQLLFVKEKSILAQYEKMATCLKYKSKVRE